MRIREEITASTRLAKALLIEMEKFIRSRNHSGSIIEAWSLILRALNVTQVIVEKQWYHNYNFRFTYTFDELAAIIIRRLTRSSILIREVSSLMTTTRSFEN